MKENKYYTPDISEFHIGFEYEYQYDAEKWRTEKCILENIESDIETVSQALDLEDSLIKVKYLDSEDIESFGFKRLLSNEINALASCGNSYFDSRIRKNKAHYFYNDKKFRLFKDLDNDLIFIKEPLTDGHPLFFGKVKNKSELEKLLKMLGIIE